MAYPGNLSLRQDVIYEVFVRNHTKEGTFRALEADLPRIAALGADWLWLMPIHPIGRAARKGSLGCPYANRDYRTVNPEYGTMEDFSHLVGAIHDAGMKCMIDVVYNHASPDSTLAREHPEFFFHRPDGQIASKVPEWTDAADLDYTQQALWDYQIESLLFWAEKVDGFRCDVASTVPAAFWQAAREAVEQIHPGFVWLGESVHLAHIRRFRELGYYAATDSELYAPFDVLYSYDIRPTVDDYWAGRAPLGKLMDAINYQEYIFPQNYCKLRCLENHDQPRAAALIPEEDRLRIWTAFSYFVRGTTLLYAGQEVCSTHQPSLFDRDTVDWNTGRDLTPLMRKLYAIKKRLPVTGAFHLDTHAGVVCASYKLPGETAVGVFPLDGHPGACPAPLADGEYRDELTGAAVQVQAGSISVGTEPVILL
jgi:glycosidase